MGVAVCLARRDLRLVLEAAEELAVSLPGVAVVQQLFDALASSGDAGDGTRALVRSLDQMAAGPRGRPGSTIGRGRLEAGGARD
jgi:NAD-binding of NADP-dependent 3-hydroxyisobutyrate dehydrogenase